MSDCGACQNYCGDCEEEIDRLRAELAEVHFALTAWKETACNHRDAQWKAEAAIARVRACCQDGDVQTFEPPGWVGTDEILRALDGAE